MVSNVTRARLVFGSIVVTSLLAPSLLQPALDQLWRWLLNRSDYQVSERLVAF